MIPIFNFARIYIHGKPRIYFDTKQENPINVRGYITKQNWNFVKSIEFNHKVTWICEEKKGDLYERNRR